MGSATPDAADRRGARPGGRARSRRAAPVAVVVVLLAALLAGLSGSQRRYPCGSTTERFCSRYPYAFVDARSGRPVDINGVNIKRAPYIAAGSTAWQTDDIIGELDAIAARGNPAFNTVRLDLDWPWYQVEGPHGPQLNEAAFGQLDRVIDRARQLGLNVILLPITIRGVGSWCREPPMAGAVFDVPRWAWRAVGLAPTDCRITGSAWGDRMGAVLALPQAAAYLRAVVHRYDGATARGRQVIAVDLVNEPHAAVPAAHPDSTGMFDRLLAVYRRWIASTGPGSVRSADPDKILVLEPPVGDSSLAGVDLAKTALAGRANLVFSFHDYFAGIVPGRAASRFGPGYSAYGFPTAQERTLTPHPRPYGDRTVARAVRVAQHRAYVQRWLDWLGPARLPLYIGEYGILDPCSSGRYDAVTLRDDERYARDTEAIYDHDLRAEVDGRRVEIRPPRTAWVNGQFDGFALLWRSAPAGASCGATPNRAYFPYARTLTGGATHG